MVQTEFADGLFVDSSGSAALEFKYSMLPSDYLKFATFDIHENQDERACVNGVTNAKRALHLRIESLAEIFGSAHIGINGHSHFPKLIDFVGKCGVVAPGILRRLNKIRNEVEHRYFVPSFDQVEDFVDIVQLFLSATEGLISQFPTDVDLSSDDEDLPGIDRRRLTISTNPRSGLIDVRALEVKCEVEKLKLEARRELEKLQVELKQKTEADTENAYWGTMEEVAFRNAALSYTEESTCSFHVAEDDQYFDWLAILLEKTR
ncbi:hypothetical protein ACJ5NV_01570 [Loktanella agnita]|uniref:hypothetical protein n=1 Tax=Loktanella agnita TaxID=287097 RepID=UPI0039887FDA